MREVRAIACAMTSAERARIAEEIIREIDAMQLATCAQVADIHKRAQQGEFDDYTNRASPGRETATTAQGDKQKCSHT